MTWFQGHEMDWPVATCARCEAKFYDDGRDSDAGWVTPGLIGDEFICTACQTPSEDEALTATFVASVERGQRLAEREGRPYLGHLATLADDERARIQRQRAEVEDLNRRLGGGSP